jgi:HSP20 family protein
MFSTSTTSYHTALSDDNTSTLGFDPSASWSPEAIPQLTIDMYYRGDHIYVISTIGGVRPEDLDITVDSNVLYIKGIRRKPYNDNEVQLEVGECFWGEFIREIVLNETANTDLIEANLNNGILTIKIPIIRARSKKVQIRLGS